MPVCIDEWQEIWDNLDWLKHHRHLVEQQLDKCLGDMERWPIKQELAAIDKRIKELEESNGQRTYCNDLL